MLNFTPDSTDTTLCSSSDHLIDDYNSLPRLDLNSSVSSIPHLTNSDVDLHMPSDVNFNYYSSSDFRNNQEISDYLSENAFSFLHCNIRSLSANKNNLKHLLYELKCSFTLIALTETKLAVANDSLSNLNLHGYQFLSQPSLSNAGGVGFYVRDNYNFSVRSDLSITESGFEALWIEVENNTQSNSLCGVIYRHPHCNIDSFMEYLNSSIEKTHRENKVYILMGDFNLDLLKFESHKDIDNFLNAMLTTNFQPQIIQPTRLTEHSATLIDNIFLNTNREMFSISGNIIYDLTDHLPNFLITSNYTCLPNNIKMYKRDFTNFHESAVIEERQSVKWEEIVPPSSCRDPNYLFDSLYTKLSEIIDTHAPVKQISRGELKLRSKPWITPAIRRSILIKNKFYKKFLKTRSSYYHSKFKYYRNKLNHLIKISRKKYYNEYFSSCQGNPKKLWTGIKRIVNRKSKCK